VFWLVKYPRGSPYYPLSRSRTLDVGQCLGCYSRMRTMPPPSTPTTLSPVHSYFVTQSEGRTQTQFGDTAIVFDSPLLGQGPLLYGKSDFPHNSHLRRSSPSIPQTTFIPQVNFSSTLPLPGSHPSLVPRKLSLCGMFNVHSSS